MLIKINLKNQGNFLLIDYRKLKHFQGNLKDLSEQNYNRLKKSLEENGYFVPLFVWKDGDEYKVLDGHGRLRLFTKEQARFYYETESEQDGTYEIPVLEIEAENEIDAKKKLLVISSQYQHILQEGLDEFTVGLTDDWLVETTHFDALSFQFEPFAEEKETDKDTDKDPIYRVYVDSDDEILQEEIYRKIESLGLKPKTVTIR